MTKPIKKEKTVNNSFEIIANNILELHSDNVVEDIKQIVNLGKNSSYSAVNTIMTATYWSIGRRIVEEEQQGEQRATYGKKLLENLSRELTLEYGSGYSVRYLAYFRKFYLTIPDFSILQTRLQNLRWSHILATLRVDDEVARNEIKKQKYLYNLQIEKTD